MSMFRYCPDCGFQYVVGLEGYDYCEPCSQKTPERLRKFEEMEERQLEAMAEIRETLTEYWLEHYFNDEVGVCSLCGNRGVIDTRPTAKGPKGLPAGRLNWCICPNGQRRRDDAGLFGEPDDPKNYQ